jgi:hypothetical protein
LVLSFGNSLKIHFKFLKIASDPHSSLENLVVIISIFNTLNSLEACSRERLLLYWDSFKDGLNNFEKFYMLNMYLFPLNIILYYCHLSVILTNLELIDILLKLSPRKELFFP